ncbi:MAG: ATP-binding protein [Planctomycetes bacterium]|nr:ATP-binding protein [Planctomycetota bacterium]
MEDYSKLSSEFAHLSRLAVSGNRDDIELYVRRVARRIGKSDPSLAQKLNSTLSSPQRGSVLRDVAVPVDTDSRLELVRMETPSNVELPIWSVSTSSKLEQFVSERRHIDALAEAHLSPSRSALFTGPPGVGKTLTARWLAADLDLPLLTLDLSAVMSSYLGRTGNNLRNVLDYARQMPCVLLLDEFDAIAKRRDDSVEVGELKRLVTVLLQEIDTWPSQGILVAATNHAELLDPAVWRRFDFLVSFDVPDEKRLELAVSRFLKGAIIPKSYLKILPKVFVGKSFSDVERELKRFRREVVITEGETEGSLLNLIRSQCDDLSKADRVELSTLLRACNVSQHEVHRITGLARETIRKHETIG